jgi:osmotically-inducible protein OsmY
VTHLNPSIRLCLRLSAVMLTATALSSCALLVGGAIVGGGMVAVDRRTAGTQVEDQSIELKAASRARELATLGHINFTSYSRTLLITGEVPTENDRLAVEQAAARIENIKSVVNELGVMANSSIGTRSNDALLVTKVKATFIDAKDIIGSAYKVVAERGTVYLMGRVTEREARRGAELASSIPGVQKVVRVFDVLSEEELGSLGRPQAAPVTGSSAPIVPAVPVSPAASTPG